MLAIETMSRDQTADAAHDGSGGLRGEPEDRVLMSVQSEDVLIKAGRGESVHIASREMPHCSHL